MKKKESAQNLIPTLVQLLKGMQRDLRIKEESGEYPIDYLKGYSECSWRVMDYIEFLAKESK